MWLGTDEDIGKLLKKVGKFSLPAYGQEVKKEIVQETIIRVIMQTRSHDGEQYGALNWTGVLRLSYRCFKHSVTDYARREKTYRASTQDDTFSENEKWPAVEYLQPKDELNKSEISRFYLCSHKVDDSHTPQKIHAYNLVKEVIDQQMLEIVDEEISEFIKLCLWQCNKGYTLSELAQQTGFIGSPVFERAMFITGTQFILEQAYQDLSFVLINPKSIQIQRNAIDTCDADSDETTHFSILPDTRPNTERSAYILEVYELLKAAFDEEHRKIENPNKADFIYLSFWSLSPTKSMHKLAADCGFETDNVSGERSRFIAKVAGALKERNIDLFIDTFEGKAEVLSNNEFSRTEVEQLFSHELESQVSNNE